MFCIEGRWGDGGMLFPEILNKDRTETNHKIQDLGFTQKAM